MPVLLIALALAAAGPPRATLSAGTTSVPLAISSWCWGPTCGAPIAASTKVVGVTSGGTVQVGLTFAPTRVRVAVAGRAVATTASGHTIAWRATRGGGVTINVTGARGWVTYVGRIRLV